MVYYVGENNGSHYYSPALAASGVGMEVAQGWEKAIRQALMPVTPQPSLATAAGQGKDHSKFHWSCAMCGCEILLLNQMYQKDKIVSCFLWFCFQKVF